LAGLNNCAPARDSADPRGSSLLRRPSIYDAGEVDGETYIVMELVEGRSLSELIGSEGLPIETAIRYAAQIADALAHAHDRGWCIAT
jgi:serine/threonine protein kinase